MITKVFASFGGFQAKPAKNFWKIILQKKSLLEIIVVHATSRFWGSHKLARSSWVL